MKSQTLRLESTPTHEGTQSVLYVEKYQLVPRSPSPPYFICVDQIIGDMEQHKYYSKSLNGILCCLLTICLHKLTQSQKRKYGFGNTCYCWHVVILWFCDLPFSPLFMYVVLSGHTTSGWTWWWTTVSPRWGTAWCLSTRPTKPSSGALCWKRPTPSKTPHFLQTSPGLHIPWECMQRLCPALGLY